MQTVLNVRMDSALKERGDKVLTENGMTVSGAVRALWSLLAETHDIPEFMRKANDSEAEKRSRLAALGKLAAIAAASSSRSTQSTPVIDDKQLVEEVYDDMWEEYEALQ